MTSNSIARFPWNHRSESRLVAAERADSLSRFLPPSPAPLSPAARSPNINFNLHKCIIINSIAALADVRDVGYYSIRKILPRVSVRPRSFGGFIARINSFSLPAKRIFSSLERGIIKFCATITSLSVKYWKS